MDKRFIQAAFYSHPYAAGVFFLGRTNNSPGLYGTAGVHDVSRASWIGPASSSSFSPLYIEEREKMLDVVWTGGLALVMDEPYLSFVSFYCSRSCFFLPRGDQKERLSIMRTTRQTLGVFFGRVTYVPCHRDFGVSLAPTVYHLPVHGQWTCRDKETFLFVCSRPWWFR